MPVKLIKIREDPINQLKKLEQVYNHIIFFVYASWCPYCKQVRPAFRKVIPKILSHTKDRVLFVPLNIEKHQKVISKIDKMKVDMIPYMSYYYNGYKTKTEVGFDKKGIKPFFKSLEKFLK